MAECKGYSYLLTLLFAVLAFAGVTFSAEDNSFAAIPQVKCCRRNTTQEEHACFSELNLQWSHLQLYRLSTAEAKSISRNANAEKLAINVSFSHDSLSCQNGQTLRLSIPFREKENGSLFSFFAQDGHFQYDGYTFTPKEYCISSVSPEAVTVVTCDYTSYCTNDPQREVHKKPCLYRCCNYGEVWDISRPSMRCSNSGVNKWQLPQYDQISNDVSTLKERESKEQPVIFTWHPVDLMKQCKGFYNFQIPFWAIKEHPEIKARFGYRPFQVLANGSVWMEVKKKKWAELHPGEYCIDGFQFGNGTYTGDSAAYSLLFECKYLDNLETEETKQTTSLATINLVHTLNFLVTAQLSILVYC